MKSAIGCNVEEKSGDYSQLCALGKPVAKALTAFKRIDFVNMPTLKQE